MELKGPNNCQASGEIFPGSVSPSPAQQLISDLRVRNQNTSNLSRGTGQFYTLTTFFFFLFLFLRHPTKEKCVSQKAVNCLVTYIKIRLRLSVCGRGAGYLRCCHWTLTLGRRSSPAPPWLWWSP